MPRSYRLGEREVQMRATRERIVDAAIELFMEVGISQATMRQVGLRADVAPGTLRNHFPSRTALEEELAFERAIAALSGYFIDVSADRIDDAIRQGLGQACELVQLDRAAVVRLGPEGVLRSRIAWSVPQVEPIDTAIVVRDRFPWTFDQLLAGEVVSFSSLEEVPDEIDRVPRRARRAHGHDVALVRAGRDGQIERDRAVVARLRPHDERVVHPVIKRDIHRLHRRAGYGVRHGLTLREVATRFDVIAHGIAVNVRSGGDVCVLRACS